MKTESNYKEVFLNWVSCSRKTRHSYNHFRVDIQILEMEINVQ